MVRDNPSTNVYAFKSMNPNITNLMPFPTSFTHTHRGKEPEIGAIVSFYFLVISLDSLGYIFFELVMFSTFSSST